MPKLNRCRICHAEAEHPLHRAPEMMFGSGESFDYFRCDACGCLQIETVPDDLGKYYSGRYYSYATPTFGLPERIARWFRDRYCLTGKGIVGKRLEARNPNEKLRVLRLAGLGKHHKVLDVGAGSGYLLGTMRDHGFENVEGVDPFLQADVEFRKGCFVRKADLGNLSGSWDFILFNHSLEHMIEPLEPLLHARRLLAQDGRCIVRIPVSSSYAWETFGVHWAALDAPRHLFLHSHDSFRIVAEKAGFEIVGEVQDSDTFQFWASTQAQQGIAQRGERSWATSPKDSIFTREQVQEFAKQARELNRTMRGDQTCFILAPKRK